MRDNSSESSLHKRSPFTRSNQLLAWYGVNKFQQIPVQKGVALFIRRRSRGRKAADLSPQTLECIDVLKEGRSGPE